jgi:dCTP deaminase
MRSRYKFRGLINVSGFSVDPGYSGKLLFSVYNAGPSPVHLTEGERWFTIFFADLDRRSAFVRAPDNSHGGITSGQITAISADFLTLKGLDTRIDQARASSDERFNALERDNALIRWASAAILGFLLTFAAKSCVTGEQPRITAPSVGSAPMTSSVSGDDG